VISQKLNQELNQELNQALNQELNQVLNQELNQELNQKRRRAPNQPQRRAPNQPQRRVPNQPQKKGAKPAAKKVKKEKKWKLGPAADVGNRDIIAQAYCASKVNEGFIFAVRRPCNYKLKSNKKCSDICKSSQLMKQDGQLKAKKKVKGKCVGTLHVYGNKKQKGDLSIGLKSYIYAGACGSGACGPNYCCCKLE